MTALILDWFIPFDWANVWISIERFIHAKINLNKFWTVMIHWIVEAEFEDRLKFVFRSLGVTIQ
jgi:hypothetical protein